MSRAAHIVATVALVWAGYASASADVHYRLPWRDGQEFTITQAPGGRITSHFLKSNLNAVDIAMPEGTEVLAARGGIVIEIEDRHGASPGEEARSYEGNFVRVRHEDETVAIYAHLKHRGVAVKPGDPVKVGQPLGYSGATGDVESAHLHLGVSRWRRNTAGWMEEVSVKFSFATGVPPHVFAPRNALIVTPSSTGPALRPRFAGEARGPVIPQRRSLSAEDELIAWLQLSAFFLAAVIGMYLSWKFSRG